jgi:hypothetical protein
MAWVKRTGALVLVGVGLLVAGVLALGIGANAVAALWTERWQFGAAVLVLVGLSVVVWLRGPRRP